MPFKVMTTQKVPDGIGGYTEQPTLTYQGEGYLDLLAGSNQHSGQNAAVEQSTHVLICDYFPLYQSKLKQNQQLEADDRTYRITYVDDPVGAHSHLELYLKFVGDANG